MMRDELIEKIHDFFGVDSMYFGVDAAALADHLLADGWIRPPCKVGDTVYVVSRYYGGLWRIHECKVDSLTVYEKHIFMTLIDKDKLNFGMEISEIGKTVFLTKEEAERALAERSEK